jgi:GNAT superfamily N-acetyltransferase
LADPSAELEQINDFQLAMRRGMSTRTIPFRWGTVFLQDRYPIVWDLNVLVVEGEPAGLTGDGLIGEAHRILGAEGLAHRKVNVLDGDLGARLAEDFRKDDWNIVQIVTMVMRGRERAKDSAIEVVGLDDRAYRDARRTFLRREPYGSKETDVTQLVDKVDAMQEAITFTAYGVAVGDVIVSICEVYTDGGVAQIEDVGTLEEHRGRGYATAVVLRAIDDARKNGSGLIFLNADAADWPKDMYVRLGFEPVAYSYEFTKPPAKVAEAWR